MNFSFYRSFLAFNGSYNRKDLKYIISKQSSLLTFIKDGFNDFGHEIYSSPVQHQNSNSFSELFNDVNIK